MNELRDALGVLRDKAALHVMESESGNIHDWIFVRDVSAKALEAPSEMQRLVEWLEQGEKVWSQWRPVEEWMGIEGVIFGNLLRVILDHIRTEFLGEGK